MPDKKISKLVQLISANPKTDVVPIVDTSVDETKKITLANLPMTESAINHAYPYTVDFDGGTGQTRNLTGATISGDFSNTVDSVYIGNNVTSIGDRTFFSCPNLDSVTIGDSVTSIGYNTFESCTSLTSITIPDGVTSIGNNTFHNCTGLTDVTIGNGLSFINNTVFNDCSSLTSISIPDSVTGIGNLTFQDCSGLAIITIPDSVTSIGVNAFKNCTSLTGINLLSTTPPVINHNTFENVSPNAQIHVPLGAPYPATYGGLKVFYYNLNI